MSSIDSKQQSIPMEPISFSVNENAFRQWINELDAADNKEKLKSLAAMLTKLKQEKIQATQRYRLLKQTSSTLTSLAQQLEEIVSHSAFPFSKHIQLTIELSIQVYTAIAQNTVLICEDADFKHEDTFSQQEKSFIICYGIEAQAQVLLYLALLYKKPAEGYWNLCFLLHLFAKQNTILDFTNKQNNSCFINLFKHILIFELSHTQQFNAEEIVSLFQLLKQFSAQVSLSNTIPTKKFRGLPFVNLRKDDPPSQPKENSLQENPYIFYISCLHLIKQLVQLSATKQNSFGCSKPMLLRLIKTLTMNQQRNSERELAKDELYSIIGFNQVLKFLYDKQKQNTGHHLSPGELADLDFDISAPEKKLTDAATDNFRTEREANMTIATHFEAIEYIDHDDIWLNKKARLKQKANKKAANVDLIDQSASGFKLSIKNKNANIRVGDIIGLLIKDNLVISIIRRIISAENTKVQVGVEKLGNHAKFLSLSNAKTAIYLEHDDKTESVAIKADDFKANDYLFATENTRVKRYKVEKQLHASSLIKHLKISLS